MRYLALALIAWLLFFWLGWEVSHGQTRGFDSEARVFVLKVASPALTRAMRGFTYLGETPILFSLCFVAVLGFHRRRQMPRAWAMGVSAGGAELLEQILKHLYQRARPEPFFGTILPESYSFPSGHAMMSGTCFLTLAWLITTGGQRPGMRMGLWTVAALLALAIGCSRIYLGVHYASDVLGGYCAAVAWLFTLRAIYARP